MAKYFELVFTDGDGEVTLNTYRDEGDLLRTINSRANEGVRYISGDGLGFKSRHDIGGNFERGHLLIKGEVIVPKPKTVVTEYEL